MGESLAGGRAKIENLSSRLHPKPELGFLAGKQYTHMKPLRIGLIGYGFMGRAHSNAFRKVGNFFDLQHQPVLKAVVGVTAVLFVLTLLVTDILYRAVDPRVSLE